MSSPKPPIHPTRQQLDELEALMQRMLALPVNQLDAAQAPETALSTLAPIDMPPEWDSGDSAVLSSEAARQAQAQVTERAPVGDGELPAESREPLKEYSDNAHQEAENADAPATKIIIARPTPGERPWTLPASARRASGPVQVLMWTKRAFDRCASRLGPPGRWLRGPHGRAWIGWSGIALLATAAAWAGLEWMGWTW
jgi:hypothetical protein